jgi:hypothetical protein
MAETITSRQKELIEQAWGAASAAIDAIREFQRLRQEVLDSGVEVEGGDPCYSADELIGNAEEEMFHLSRLPINDDEEDGECPDCRAGLACEEHEYE